MQQSVSRYKIQPPDEHDPVEKNAGKRIGGTGVEIDARDKISDCDLQ